VKTAATASLFDFDLERCGGSEAAGADEAGRGCLAGPLVAAAVVFDYTRFASGRFDRLGERLNDSKKLSARVREAIFPLVLQASARVAVVMAGSDTIDREGLHKTNLRVLADCLRLVAPCEGVMLVDGRQELPDCTLAHMPVTGADAKSACVAAASVVAKVTRDRVMRRLHERYPEYGFDSHVGYATAAHKEAIALYGFTPIHRRSFNISLP